MKRHLTLVYIVALVTIIPLILVKIPAAGSQTNSPVLGVEEFMKHVDRYKFCTS